jgi:hypothetical protein
MSFAVPTKPVPSNACHYAFSKEKCMFIEDKKEKRKKSGKPYRVICLRGKEIEKVFQAGLSD